MVKANRRMRGVDTVLSVAGQPTLWSRSLILRRETRADSVIALTDTPVDPTQHVLLGQVSLIAPRRRRRHITSLAFTSIYPFRSERSGDGPQVCGQIQ
ncbi:hypothetical protein BaRGS_00037661 [Batillaria attramentaria]|uniref:Uncharacterized protein n=1 Tax=Batillaria attramentaria TaxID=370345 RepID=A0ABD0J8V1_9CAEN